MAGDENSTDSGLSLDVSGKFVAVVISALVAAGLWKVGSEDSAAKTAIPQECTQAFELAKEAKELATAAIKNSATELAVRGQHGDEFENITNSLADINTRLTRADTRMSEIDSDARERDQNIRIFILDRTANRFTSEDASEHERDNERKFDGIEKVLSAHERRMNMIEKDAQSQDKELDTLFRKTEHLPPDNRWIQNPMREN